MEFGTTGTPKIIAGGLASTRERDTGEVDGPTAVAFKGNTPYYLTRNLQSDAVGISSIPGLPEFGFGQIATQIEKTLKQKFVAKHHGRPVLENGKRIVVTTTRTVKNPGPVLAHQRLRRPPPATRNPQPATTLGGLPGETTYDSDPHDIVAYRGGFAVADAGANDVLTVSSNRRISLAARLPTQTEQSPAGALGPGSPAQTIQAQAVPSAITVGPDGAPTTPARPELAR